MIRVAALFRFIRTYGEEINKELRIVKGK